MFSLDSAPHFCYSEVKEMIKNPDLMRYKITDDLYPEHIEELLRIHEPFVKDVDIKYEQKLSDLRGGM